MKTADMLIVGGGVIGLSIAFHLSERAPGLRVVVADAGTIGSGSRGQASPAAAGMLAPFAEAHADGPLVRLGAASLESYPAFIEAARLAAGVNGDSLLAITGSGMLRVARTPREVMRLKSDFAWQASFDRGMELLSGNAAREREPELSPHIRMVVYSPRERQVDPRRLLHTLLAACRVRGVEICEEAPVTRVVGSATSVSVEVGGQPVSCGNLIVAGGAWSRALGCLIGVSLPVAPVRGQILALQPPPGMSPIRHTLYTAGVYLVPRPEGRIVVGATEEPDAGFDREVRPADTERLCAATLTLAPTLRGAPLDGPAWTGLRPASPDGLPLLGRLPGLPNVWAATAHYRNGILLAPITGDIISRELLGDTPHPRFAPDFRADRFGAEQKDTQ